MTSPRTIPDDASDWADHEKRIRALEVLLARSVIATQYQTGNNNNYVALPAVNGAYRRDAGNDFQVSYTPPVDCYWDVQGYLNRLQKTDANWHYVHSDLRLSPADADGNSVSPDWIVECHSAGVQYGVFDLNFRWRLKAGVAYTCKMHVAGIEGGTWTYYQGINYAYMRGTAFVLVGGMP